VGPGRRAVGLWRATPRRRILDVPKEVCEMNAALGTRSYLFDRLNGAAR